MANSYMYSPVDSTLTLVVDNTTVQFKRDHPSFNEALELARAHKIAEAAAVFNVRNAAIDAFQKAITECGAEGVVHITGTTPSYVTISLNNRPLPDSYGSYIESILRDGQDVTFFVKMLVLLAQNPVDAVKSSLGRWLAAKTVVLDQDGYIIGYKRVNNQLKSFYDGRTPHQVGAETSLAWVDVDTNENNTCSRGLHFCSHEYLPHYHGGQGRILVLKISPADLAALPPDYGTSKGRCVRYTVTSEITERGKEILEKGRAATVAYTIDTSEDADALNVVANATEQTVNGYDLGYRHGRAKRARVYFADQDCPLHIDEDYFNGYNAGYKDGRNKKARLHTAKEA